ncbi:AAA domain-containing protein, partial [Vararia minispora EC-137]
STFAEALERNFPRFRRCCQDNLGSRRAVESMARSALQSGLSVCIDRTNIDQTQRSHWVDIAGEFPGVPVRIIVFDTPYGICAQRLRTRHGHPTITRVETALRVLAQFASTYQPPEPHEGYDRLLQLGLADQSPSYSEERILDILQKLREASTTTAP